MFSFSEMRFCARRQSRRKTAGGASTLGSALEPRVPPPPFENARSLGRRRASSGNGAARAGQVRAVLPLRLARGLESNPTGRGRAVSGENGALNRFERPGAEFDLFAVSLSLEGPIRANPVSGPGGINRKMRAHLEL